VACSRVNFTFTFNFNTILMHTRGRNFVYAVTKVRRLLRRLNVPHKLFKSILLRSLIQNLTLMGANQNVESTGRNLFSRKVWHGFRYAYFV